MIVVKPNCFVIDFVPGLTNVHHNDAPVQVMTTCTVHLYCSGDDHPLLDAGTLSALPQRRPQVGADGGAPGVRTVKPEIHSFVWIL